jgi:hypothetical protein
MTKHENKLTDGNRAAPGMVCADAVYRADELKARMGWREAAFRAACRRGLKTHRVGKRVYVTGADAIAFVTGRGVVG